MADYHTPGATEYGSTPPPTFGADASPFYGEHKRSPKWLVWAVAGIIGVIVIFSTTVGIVFGIVNETPQHIMLTGTMLCLVALTIIGWRLYTTSDEDSKLFWLLVGIIFVLLLTCVTLNAYVWPPLPAKCEPVPSCTNSLYNTNSKQCVLEGLASCGAGKCPSVYSYTQLQVTCCNCSSTACVASPSPSPVLLGRV